GCLGGYVAGSPPPGDAGPSSAPGVIFTGAPPPAVCAAGPRANRPPKTSPSGHRPPPERTARGKRRLRAAARPGTPRDAPPIPVAVGNPQKCQAASDLLLTEHGIYIQPINYPTVPKGTERLRITPTPYHDDALVDHLADALVDVWQRLRLPLSTRAVAAE